MRAARGKVFSIRDLGENPGRKIGFGRDTAIIIIIIINSVAVSIIRRTSTDIPIKLAHPLPSQCQTRRVRLSQEEEELAARCGHVRQQVSHGAQSDGDEHAEQRLPFYGRIDLVLPEAQFAPVGRRLGRGWTCGWERRAGRVDTVGGGAR